MPGGTRSKLLDRGLGTEGIHFMVTSSPVPLQTTAGTRKGWRTSVVLKTGRMIEPEGPVSFRAG